MKKITILSLTVLFIFPLTGFNQASIMEDKQLKTAEGNWSYSTSHQGSNALLFIHGGSSSKKIWKNQYTLTLNGYQNIFVDLLGYGESDKPESGYSLSNWIEGLHRILEQESIEEVAIVAHSNVVIFAKEYYRAHPKQVSHLLLLDGMLKPMIAPAVLNWMHYALERPDYEAFMASNIDRMPVAGLNEADATLLKEDSRNTPKRIH